MNAEVRCLKPLQMTWRLLRASSGGWYKWEYTKESRTHNMKDKNFRCGFNGVRATNQPKRPWKWWWTYERKGTKLNVGNILHVWYFACTANWEGEYCESGGKIHSWTHCREHEKGAEGKIAWSTRNNVHCNDMLSMTKWTSKEVECSDVMKSWRKTKIRHENVTERRHK